MPSTKVKPDFKALRKAMGITQQVMAIRAGVSMVTIHKLENDNIEELQMRTRQGIARAYGVDPITGEAYSDPREAADPADAPPHHAAGNSAHAYSANATKKIHAS